MRDASINILFLAFVLMTGIANADGPINEKYSYRDFTGIDLSTYPAAEFSNSTIVGSCFYQEARNPGEQSDPRVHIFPEDIVNVTLVNCNSDNVRPRDGLTFGEGTTNRRVRVQKDLQDWILTTGNEPLEPVNKSLWIERGVSIDPKDIPTKVFTEEEHRAFMEQFND